MEAQASNQATKPQHSNIAELNEGLDLNARDAAMAVDPSQTNWSFEGSKKKTVYLTIDDGPSENTPAILDILDKYGCKATFFVVGQNPSHFHYIKEAYDKGHTIGMHTFTHDYSKLYSSTDAYYRDLEDIAKVVKDQIGYVPCFVRFPGGSSNSISANYTPGIMTSLTKSVVEQGFQYYDWNMSSGDGADLSADEIYNAATESNEYNNVMLLCHDSATKQTTVEALPRIIEHYQSLGYTFEAIDRDSVVIHHGVNN
ncbi:MAG: polysaccharide deacetylase [Eggerthellaceae bacterium]|nr:polysaccharide deacetylase [Eggerthellaceae bacterium]